MKRFVAVSALAVALLALAPAVASARGFSYGVTAGEVTTSSAILWTRSNSTGRVVLQVSTSKRFSRKRTKAYRLRARASNDRTVQRKVTKLKAGKRYYFRFLKGRNRSERGTFRTAPSRNANVTVKFGWTGDTDATPAVGQTQPFWNNFDVFRRMQDERSNFNIHFGDTIYSDSEVPGRLNPVALTVPAKWAKYKTNLGQRKLQRLRGSAGFYSHWDDHEFVNDFSREENSFSSAPNVNGETLYKAGVKAFRDYSPVSYTSRDGIYRTRRWGRNLELFFLDQRSFRSAKADVGTSCNNPADRLGRPGADGTAVGARRVRHPPDAPAAARLAAVPGHDSRSQPHLPRQAPAQPLPERHQELDGPLQGDHERAADLAVLRASVRPLGGL